jgi:hypothetical protein
MSDAVFTARGLLEQFSETVWFPLVLGMKHTLKELILLREKLKKDGLVDFRTPRRRFDRIIRDYEHAVISYVTVKIRKDLTIMSQYAGAGAAGAQTADAAPGRGRDAGQANWLRDTFGDAVPGALDHLDQRSQDNCRWLQTFSSALALKKSSVLFVASVVSLIQRTYADARAEGNILTWLFVKRMVRHRLPDDCPRMLLETFVTMTCPDEMAISEWTASCTLVHGLLTEKALLTFPAALSFSYWSGQVTMHE